MLLQGQRCNEVNKITNRVSLLPVMTGTPGVQLYSSQVKHMVRTVQDLVRTVYCMLEAVERSASGH